MTRIPAAKVVIISVPSPTDISIATRSEPGSLDLVVVAAVWTSFFLYGAVAAPVPAANEPHYLCKARHYWQPEWCANDFFLQSSNAHTVFFATVGRLTEWLSLDQTAWTGRLLAMLVLAAGWCALMATFANGRWFALQTCWVFLALQVCGNFSGEWLVGGVEGKVFSYGLLFAALALILRRRLITAGLLAGMAVAMHPVVGAWGVLAFAGAVAGEVTMRLFASGREPPKPDTTSRVTLLRISIAMAGMILVSLAGLIPVFRLLSEQVPARTKFAANYIQVYYRLAHHLDPIQFSARAYEGYAALIAIWIVAMVATQRPSARKVFDRIVAFAILFAIVGVIIGWGPRPASLMSHYAERAQLLKFYPFRLADVLIPMAVSIGAVSVLATKGPRIVRVIGFGLLIAAVMYRAHSTVEVNRYSGELRADWIDACHWIDRHLPADAVVQAPHNGWAFKWFAQRAEYVAFKDCPQDSAGIVEWNRRLLFLKKWYEDHYADEFYSADELRQLHRETGITHLLTDRLGPLELAPLYRNATFQVYDLTSLD